MTNLIDPLPRAWSMLGPAKGVGPLRCDFTMASGWLVQHHDSEDTH